MLSFLANTVRLVGVVAVFQMLVACGGTQEVGSEARRRVQAGALLVDVRTAAEFEAGHIEGARNIPVQELQSRLGELGAQEGSIVVYCGSGRRSAHAQEILSQAGYTNVYDLGAMSNW